MMSECFHFFFTCSSFSEVGDLGEYLLEEKLVTSIRMRANTFHSQVSGRVPPGFSDMPQLIPNRVLQSSTGQRSPSTP